MFSSLKARLAVLLACIACLCAVAGASAGTASATCWPCADNTAQSIWYDGYNPPVAQGLVSASDTYFPVGSILNIYTLNSGGYVYYGVHLHYQEQHIGLLSTTYSYYSCPLTLVYAPNGSLATAWFDGCTRYA